MNKSVKLGVGVILFLALLFSTQQMASAAPAIGIFKEETQPSGETFQARLTGDEVFSAIETDTGDLVSKDNDGFWYYTEKASNGLKKGNSKYILDQKPLNAASAKDIEKAKKDKLSKNIQLNSLGAPSMESISPNQSLGIDGQIGSSPENSIAALAAPHKLLVLLVSFNNISIQNSPAVWANAFFGASGSTVNNYYKEVSGGKFYFQPAFESQGTASDGVVNVQLNYNHPNTGSSTGAANQLLVKDALTAADSYVNFAQFDTDGNGYISNSELHIITVIAGDEAAFGATTYSVWAHRWALWGTSATTLDTKSLGNSSGGGGYTQMGEMLGGAHMATIGTACHELGHDLGLPDLYDTDSSSQGVGPHSLMAAGNWNRKTGEYPGDSPAHLDPWCKIQLGFATPTTITSGNVNINSVSTGAYNIVKVPTADPNQYFLIENRQFLGYDGGLAYACASGGLAIWHIDEAVIAAKIGSNTVNNDETHKGVDIEEADVVKRGGSLLDTNNPSHLKYDSYYYTGNNTVFGDSSNPNSKLYSNASTQINMSINSGSTETMSIKIGEPNKFISSLSISKGTLSPAFVETVYQYSATVTNSTSSIDLSAVLADAGSTMTVNGAAVTSGQAKTIALALGVNQIRVIVTAADNQTATYTIDVTRETNTGTGKLQWSSTVYSAYEGKSVALAIVRNDGYQGAVSVRWTISGGTATQDVDFTGATTGVVVLADGQRSSTISIPIVADSTAEAVETIAVTLSEATDGATLGASTAATINITNYMSDSGTLNNAVRSLNNINPTMTMAPGGSTQGRILVMLNNGVGYNLYPGNLVWKSANDTVATVDSNGLIQAIAPGKTTITGTFGGKTVVYAVDASVTDISFDRMGEQKLKPTEDTVSLNLTATYSDGSQKDITKDSATVWSSGDVKIATVTSGDITTTTKPGATDIKASYGGKRTSIRVNTNLVGLSMPSDQSQQKLKAGDNKTMVLTATYSDNTTANVYNEAVWQSSDAKVASVTEGAITVTGFGKATIKATYAGKSVSLAVDTSIIGIRLNQYGEIKLKPNGESKSLVLYAIYADGTEAEITNDAAVIWKSTNTNVATVANGVITATQVPGNGSVTATYAKKTITVKVNSGLMGLVVPASQGSIKLKVGEAKTVALTAVYADGSTANVNGLAEWKSAGSGIASVAAAVITAAGKGKTTITGVYKGKSLPITVEVNTTTVAGISFDKADEIKLKPTGQTDSVKVILTNNDGTQTDITANAGIVWTTSNQNVATISNNGTIASTQLPGLAVVSATYQGKKASIKINTSVLGISIPSGQSLLCLKSGDSKSVVLTAVFADGSTADVTKDASWSSLKTEVATVVDGTISMLSLGKSDITATYKGKTLKLSVDSSIIGLKLSKNGELKLKPIEETDSVVVTAILADGSQTDVTADPSTVWTSVNTKVATVDKGVIKTTLLPGITDIQASYGGKKISIKVNTSILGLSVGSNESIVKIKPGNTKTLTLKATYADGTTMNVNAAAEWNTAKATIATVSGGVVTATGFGKTNLTASYKGKKVTVAVDASLLALVSDFVGEIKLKPTTAASTMVLTATYADGSQENITNDSGVIWASTNALSATVDKGAVTSTETPGVASISSTFGGKKLLWKANSNLIGCSIPNNKTVTKVVNGNKITVFAFYGDGSSKDVSSEATWLSSNTKIVTISGGTVTVTGLGTASLKATYKGKTSTINITTK